MQAVSKGMQVQGWLENLPPDEMPPQEIWHHNERLEAWFDKLKTDREQKYASSGQEFESVPGTETIEYDLSEEIKQLSS